MIPNYALNAGPVDVECDSQFDGKITNASKVKEAANSEADLGSKADQKKPSAKEVASSMSKQDKQEIKEFIQNA